MNKKIIVIVMSLCFPVLVNAETLVVVSEKSELASLSNDEVRQLYMGTASSVAGDRVMLLDMPDGSAVRRAFYSSVAGKTESQLKSYWARMIFTGRGTPPKQVRDSRDMVSKLKADTKKIGYLDKNDLQPGLKVLLRLPES